MRITTAKQARQFIGKEVLRKGRFSLLEYRATLLDVRGKNVLVDHCGTNDWLWLPDVILESIEAPLPTQQP